jgi:hypothetical protein
VVVIVIGAEQVALGKENSGFIQGLALTYLHNLL